MYREKLLFEKTLKNFLEQVQELSFYEKLNDPNILKEIILHATWKEPDFESIKYVRDCLKKNLNQIISFEYFIRMYFECLKHYSQSFKLSNIYYLFDYLFNWRIADKILDENNAFSQLDRIMYNNFALNNVIDAILFLIKKKANFLKTQTKLYFKKVERKKF